MRRPSFLDLSPAQQDLLIDMPFEGRHLVTGPPGSGKTLVALHRAALLDIADRQVAFLTYSNLLRQYATTAFERLEVNSKITTFHKWFRGFWIRHFGEPPPQGEREGSFDWTEIIATLLRSGRALNGEFDSLVVDEGQDLPKEFYLLCGQLTADVTVFADDNQRIGPDQSTLNEISKALGRDMTTEAIKVNYRNTRAIADFAACFFCGPVKDLPMTPGRGGPSPTLTRDTSESAFAERLMAYARDHPDHEIGVALRSTLNQTALAERLRARGVQFERYVGESAAFRTVDFGKPGIRLFSTVSMKGLEFDTLFVPGLEFYNEDPTGASARMRFYVLATRARHELHLSYQGERPPPIVSGIPDRLLRKTVW